MSIPAVCNCTIRDAAEVLFVQRESETAVRGVGPQPSGLPAHNRLVSHQLQQGRQLLCGGLSDPDQHPHRIQSSPKQRQEEVDGPFLSAGTHHLSEPFVTTLGQLNFFRWAIKTGVLKYAIENASAIEKHMLDLSAVSLYLQSRLVFETSSGSMAFCSVYGEFETSDKKEGRWLTVLSRAPEGLKHNVHLVYELAQAKLKPGVWLLTVKPLNPDVRDMVLKYETSRPEIVAIKEKVFAAADMDEHVAMINFNSMESVADAELVNFYDAVDDFIEDDKLFTLQVGAQLNGPDSAIGWCSRLDEQNNTWSSPVMVTKADLTTTCVLYHSIMSGGL